MKARALAFVVIGLLTAPTAASAQLFGIAGESSREFQFELKFGNYTPDIDSEGVDAYSTIFDDKSMFMTRIELDWQLFQGFGSIAIGGEFGYAQVTGNAVAVDTSDTTTDETQFKMIPLSLSLIYHLDIMAVKWRFPVVPFFKAGIDYCIWWINDGLDETSSYSVTDPDTGKSEKFEGTGDTWGWHVATGVKFLLDNFAPQMAQTFDNEVGVNNSYLFVEYVISDIDDFGSDKSFQLGDENLMFGLAFEF
jgi:hypothetical protein